MRVGAICGECRKYYQGESCPNCQDIKSGKTVNIIPDIQPHFNRGLGDFVTGRADYRTKLREKGLIEVGNERKYVDPGLKREAMEKQMERHYEKMKPEAMRILNDCECKGVPLWN